MIRPAPSGTVRPRRPARAVAAPLLAMVALAVSAAPAPGGPVDARPPSEAAGAPAPDADRPQEAADTARAEPPGGPPPRSVIAPDSARLDTMVARVASKLRCPVCRNQSVLESTATLSRQMQSVIREKLAEGESPEEIKAYFVDKYGEWILLRPRASGLGLLVYVLPALALLGGGGLVFWLLRRWSRPSPAGEASGGVPGTVPPDEEAGLEHLPPEEREWIREQVKSGEPAGGPAAGTPRGS